MAWHRGKYWIIALYCIVKECTAYPVDWSNAGGGGGGGEEIWGPALASVALLGACAVLALLGCVCCRQAKSPPFEEFTDTASNHSLSTAGFVNPLAAVAPTPAATSVCTEFTIFPPPGATVAASNPLEPPAVRFEPLPDIRPRGASIVTAVEVEPVPPATPLRPAAFSSGAPAPCELLDEPSFPRGHLKYLRELGKGWFGKVVEGEALEGSGNDVAQVVVRILRDDAPSLDQALFLREVASLRALTHPNLLRVLGCCCEAQPLLILMDLCPMGDLKTFLVERREQAQSLAQKGEITRLMCELAAGLEHMARAGFIHTDLAARNCQLTSDLTLKIGDYGTSIEKFREEYYCAGDVAVPIRWCAPESLVCTELTIETKQVTSAANVWTLGVVLWEVLQFGQLPYAHLSDDEVILTVLGPPYHCPSAPSLSLPHSQYLYHLMKLCWTSEPERPSAGQILAMLQHLHSSRDQAGDSAESFEQRWALLRPNKAGVCSLYLPSLEHNVELQDFTPSPSFPDRNILSYKSPSLQNLRGSLEDLHDNRATSSLPNSTDNLSSCDLKASQDEVNIEDIKLEMDYARSPSHVEECNRHFLYGEAPPSLEDEDARRICEAIQDLDDALAMEKTSSSEESSRESTPRQKHPSKVGSSSSVLDFRLQQASASDSEEEATWRGRVERGEFTEKVRQKSRSVQDLMVLTHIDTLSSAEHSSDDADAPTPRPLLATEPFKSEGNICGAIVIEGLLDSFRQLRKLSKIEDDGVTDQSAAFTVPQQPIISENLVSTLDFNNISASLSDNCSSNNSGSQESKIDEFLASNTSKYLISEEKQTSASPHHTKHIVEELNTDFVIETNSSNTHDSSIGETVELLGNEDSANFNAIQSRQEIRKTLLLNLDNLDNTQRDSSSQSCSVTTSTDDSDLTILMNPNLDTPVEMAADIETPDTVGDLLDSCPVAGETTQSQSTDIEVAQHCTDSMTLETMDLVHNSSSNDVCPTSPTTVEDESTISELISPAEGCSANVENVLDTPVTVEEVDIHLKSADDFVSSDTVGSETPELNIFQQNKLESGSENSVTSEKENSEECSLKIIDGVINTDVQLKFDTETLVLGTVNVEATAGQQNLVINMPDIKKSELVECPAESNSEECKDMSAKPSLSTAKSRDEDRISDLIKSRDMLEVSEVLETILANIAITEELASIAELNKSEPVENNNSKIEKCCSVQGETKPSLSSNYLLPLPHEVSKSKVNLSLGVLEPSSMIAFEPNYPKHHSEHRLRKMKDMPKDFEFSKFKCQEVLRTEPVGMIAFDSSVSSSSHHREIPTLLSPEPLFASVESALEPAISESLTLVVERKPIEVSPQKCEILQDCESQPLSTIAFDFVQSAAVENNEALILDADDEPFVSELLEDLKEENRLGDDVVDKVLVIEKVFKPKRLEELCEEALILDVDESHMPKVLEESSMEAIILDVDSTNLAEEICMENPMLDAPSSLNLDNVGAINRLDSLIRESVCKENTMLKEKSDSWGSGEFRSRRISELDGLRSGDEMSKHVTPDDERSSDSDFREKMSLSESGEDAGDKYNLEDIEGELGQLGTPSSDSGLERTPHDDLKSFDGREGEEDEGDEFWKQQMASLQQAAGKALALFHEAVNTDLSPCEEEKAYATSWFRRSEEESSPKSSSSTGSGTGNCGDNSYVSFGLDDECVAAIRNELQQKLPKLERQNSDSDLADGEEEEIKREDITIHYNIYPVPLSPILEEQESLFASENCSPSDSPGFFLHAQRAVTSMAGADLDSLSNSVSNSPHHSPPQSSPIRQSPQASSPKSSRSEQFEADIRAALEQCTAAEPVQDDDEEEDVLYVNTETNEATLVESPLRPKLPYLAFVNGQQIYSGSAEVDNQQWVEDEESPEKTQAYLKQFDAVTSFSEPDGSEDGSGVVSWMSVPITRAPMPSPEEEARRVTDPPPCHTPDWESDTASEGSSSSGEFVWKEGDREAQVKAVSEDDAEEIIEEQNQQQPGSPSKAYEATSEFPMAVITEEDEEEDEEIDSASTSSSGTEFVPSSWNSEAAPSRSSLRSPDKKSDQKKNVSFKRQKYHCVYEYPREASDTEPEETSESRRQWGLPQQVDYASFADWELLDDELTEAGDQDTDPDSSEHTKPETFDFYKLSSIDCDFTNGMPEDGEFFISSSARPFHLNTSSFSSQFFPGLASVETAAPISPGGSSGGSSSNSTTPPSPLSPASMGELRHTRDRLKLDLPKFSLAPVTPKSPVPSVVAPSVEPAVDESQA